MFFFFFNDTATTEIYTLSLHDALPIYLLGVGDEVRREVAAVELHAFHDIELGLGGLGLLDGDHALVADLLHGMGDHLADVLVAIGRDRADLGDLVGGLHLLGAGLDEIGRAHV